MGKIENKSAQGTFMDFEMQKGILIATYKENLVIDKNAAMVSVRERLEFTEYKEITTIVDATNVKEVTKEARDYFGSEEGSHLLKASAIYTNSVLATYLANFLIAVNLHKTLILVKLFNDKQKAIDWLNQFK